MMGLGFKDAQNMAGGITAWIQDGYPITTPTTITTTSASVITTLTNTSASSVNGLQLRLSVSTASLTSEEMLEINVIEYNTLSKTNNMAANNTCGIDGLALGACKNIYIQPFGVALFQGHFTAQNISQATALRIYPLVPCPLFIRKVTGYIFLPDSINAAVLPGGNVSSLTPMSAEVTVTGMSPLPIHSLSYFSTIILSEVTIKGAGSSERNLSDRF